MEELDLRKLVRAKSKPFCVALSLSWNSLRVRCRIMNAAREHQKLYDQLHEEKVARVCLRLSLRFL